MRADGRISIACPGLWNDDHVEAWQPITTFAKALGAKTAIQLAHAGRKASTMRPWDDHQMAGLDEGGWRAVAPSPLAFEGYPEPDELSSLEIEELVGDFGDAAIRAIDAGFDVIEIHGAHGYLIHEFLSPLSNRRGDDYGGSFENRTRFLRQVIENIRSKISDSVPLLVRISATDYVEGGWDLPQSVELAKVMKSLGVDLVDVSSGGNVAGVRIPLGPGYQVPFSESIRRESNVMTGAVGLITEPLQALEIVEQGRADAVLLARAMLRNPRWALGAAEELGDFVPWPLPMERARTLKE